MKYAYYLMSALCLSLAGCASHGLPDASVSPDNSAVVTAATVPPTKHAGPTIVFNCKELALAEDQVVVVQNAAQYLAKHTKVQVILTGYATDTGSVNMSLAETQTRLQAIVTLMKVQGVQDTQIQLLNFGSAGDYYQSPNCRVEFTYLEPVS